MNREAWVTGAAVFANEVSHVDESSAARLGAARRGAVRWRERAGVASGRGDGHVRLEVSGRVAIATTRPTTQRHHSYRSPSPARNEVIGKDSVDRNALTPY